MEHIRRAGVAWSVVGLAASAMLGASCGRHPEDSAAATLPANSARRGQTKESSAALAPANESLKAGAYDDAAAKLLELQASGRSFTPVEAAEYRKALNEAYTRALEAAEKGDKRAEAAIQMIRAANNR
jgi:hypothetical protein